MTVNENKKHGQQDNGKKTLISKDFLSPFNPQKVEETIYKEWESCGYFNPDTLEGSGETYTIIMPPPNANGALHAGHALFVALEDMMIRYQRMRGKRTLWLPGADHAGFETQVVYEKKLEKEGTSRFALEGEELYQRILDFTLENKRYMENQLRALGASCDWSRSVFTLDAKVKEQVYETFKKLDEDGLLYRGLRSVSWCPKHQTGFSDLELVSTEQQDSFYYFQYGPFVIGTVRPETKFSDKYVVVHPDDERYAQYEHGQTFVVEWINGPVTATLIKDEAGNPEVGSGAMTITPWHSAVDWEIAQKHDLSYEQIIDERGKLTDVAGEFAGMNIRDARKAVVERLREKNLLVKVDEKYVHSVPRCYKCKREVEPQLKEQWFISVQPLAKAAREAIEKEEVSFVTERYRRVALNWLDGLRDWNISRQIVWGIPIPAKICQSCQAGIVDLDEKVTKCTKCGGEVKVDTDTFDTWFSSGQWPFVALGYPDSSDYKTFYPTNVMETGHDILFFWVLRMIMLGLYRTGTVPFRTVYLHGLVRDAKGEKMSKSKNNVIDPIGVVSEYGVDAMRMGYIVGTVPGENVNFSPDKIRGYKRFANKVWNIARFVLTETSECSGIGKQELTVADKGVLDAWAALCEEITSDMEKYNFHLASEKIYHYLWHTFADKIIEESKPLLQEDGEAKVSRQTLLLRIFSDSLKVLHPFMPFVTEAIWKHVPDCPWKKRQHIIVERWPC